MSLRKPTVRPVCCKFSGALGASGAPPPSQSRFFKVIEESLGFLKNEKAIEILGGDLIGRISYRFNLTDLGRKRAQEAMKMCAYVGPAPVPLEDYVEQTYRQAVTAIDVNPDALRAAMSHLV